MFTAATDAFAEANVGVSIDETFARFAPVMTRAQAAGLWVRGYISVAFGCPYAGAVDSAAVAQVAERLIAISCDEICLADTIGVASPAAVRETVRSLRPAIALDRLALHFHDTAGTALENVDAALDEGIRIFDAAAGGLGGCPFAPGAPGNLATERLIERLDRSGLSTGVDGAGVAQAVAILAPHVASHESRVV